MEYEYATLFADAKSHDKKCAICHLVKNESEFSFQCARTEKRHRYCRKCHSEKYYRTNAKKINAKRKEAYCRDLEASRAKARAHDSTPRKKEVRKAYYLKNVAHIREAMVKYNQSHKAQIAATRAAYRRKNKKLLKDNLKKWIKANPEKYKKIIKKSLAKHKDRVNAHKHKRRSRLKAGGTYTASEWNDLKRYYDFTCLRCRRREPEIELTVDHVIPISKHGPNTIDNLQPLCRSCNSIKNDSHIDYRAFAKCAM